MQERNAVLLLLFLLIVLVLMLCIGVMSSQAALPIFGFIAGVLMERSGKINKNIDSSKKMGEKALKFYNKVKHFRNRNKKDIRKITILKVKDNV